MLIENNQKFVPELKELWHNVFGDEYEYINLFFDSIYKNCKTFAHFENEKIVSVFYLLNCKIRFEGRIFNGCYLYAAATAPEFRKKGIMGKLLCEGQQYAKENGRDFICLVPGNTPLYDYYSKFGFVSAMYKSTALLHFDEEKAEASYQRIDNAEYDKRRFELTDNAFLWDEKELAYALECLSFYGSFAYKADDSVFIANKNEQSVAEFLCKKEKQSEIGSAVCSALQSKTVRADGQSGEDIKPFGMIYPINNKLKRQWSQSDIYMNLALD